MNPQAAPPPPQNEKPKHTTYDGQPGEPCQKCGTITPIPCLESYYGLCSPCHSRKRLLEDRKESARTSMESRLKLWDSLCPERYRTNPTDKIDPILFRQVLKWRFNPEGIILCGDSQRGKTTTIWHLLNRLFVMEDRSFFACSEPEFSILRDKASRGGNIDQFLNKCLQSDILFLDDIGHSATSPRHMEELYYVVEKRTSWKKPILTTTNFTRDEIEQRAFKNGTAKTAMAILNRLHACCYTYTF